jgi:hypothetical protein
MAPNFGRLVQRYAILGQHWTNTHSLISQRIRNRNGKYFRVLTGVLGVIDCRKNRGSRDTVSLNYHQKHIENYITWKTP